jgi:alpha-beta hydrolase superfamily lysophospholipase
MRHLEGQIQTSDGLSLYSQSWLPDSEPKAAVAFFHGQSDHSGRYANLVNALIPAGYALFMADLRGHGKSPGLRGHILSWEDYRRDMTALMEHARQTLPDIPHFFGGHSMGGLLALNIALDNPPGYQGVVASAPALRFAFEPPAAMITMARILSRVAPRTVISNQLDASGLTHDQAVVEAYKADPLVHGKITTRAAVELTITQADSLARAGQTTLPLLILHGSADPIIAADGSREYFEKASSADKTLKIYEGLYHEIFNELEKKQVLDDVVGWLDAHLP